MMMPKRNLIEVVLNLKILGRAKGFQYRRRLQKEFKIGLIFLSLPIQEARRYGV